MAKKITNQIGEPKKAEIFHELEPIPVDTFAGKIHVKWDSQAKLTPLGQVVFFVEFLKTSGLFADWVKSCPMFFSSPNAPDKRDILGTILLSVLAGHKRYAHITSIHCDNVNPKLLGMNNIASEDAVRRALKYNVEEMSGITWLKQSLSNTYNPLLTESWILDIDTTIKPLYGKQEGAVVGYNPHKPGRPSHVYHSYMIANIRLMLDVEVLPGNQTAGKYTAPGLWTFIEGLEKNRWPDFIRGDCSFGTNEIMSKAEAIKLPYLFKLKQSKNVKKLIHDCAWRNDWCNAGQKWQGVESKIQLQGWEHSRRVIVLRKQVPREVGVVADNKKTGQLELNFAEIGVDMNVYEYAVLVTSLKDDIRTLAQHYRDRADSENNFDELKNQWGWLGYTTKDLKRSGMMARVIALIYNWWTLFVRLIDPSQHTEALTSRPMLLHSVGKQTTHANKIMLVISSTHGEASRIHRRLVKISAFFKRLQSNAEQLTIIERWYRILSAAFIKYLRGRILKPPDLLPQGC
jgi:hypothetical protein